MKFKITTTYKFEKPILKKFKKIVKFIGKQEKIERNVFFELTIIDNKEIQKINNKYRNIDKETDVLSFSLWEEQLIKTPLLGEVFISYEKAISQSMEYGHSFQREICFLLIHGILHLLGYNHIIKSEEIIMFQKQRDIIKILKIR